MSSALQAEQRKASAARLRRLCAHVRDGPSSASLIASGAAAADSFAEGDAPRRFLPPARDVGGMPGAYPEEGEGEYEDEDEGPTLAEENAARGRNDVYNRKWDGWGYEDTEFFISDDNEVCLAGERYGQNFEAERVLPEFRAWVEAKVDGFTTDETSFPVGVMPDLDPSVMNDAFLAAIEGAYVELCFDDEERLFHAHGHTTRELYDLRTGKGFPRTPDAVVYPSSHENVETIMAAAVLHDACIIPFGGGTSVTGALLCPDTEKRMIISVDMRRMNRIKWVDRESMLCCIEAGAAGQELDKALAARGLRLGHEPDSGEFSTVGGWVATRASGMKKSVYGNIEDMLINVKVVTPIGVLDRPGNAPRQSIGPDVIQMVLGSEGMLGIVTEAVFRVHTLPEVQEFGSIVFPTFEAGVAALNDIAAQGCFPCSLRLVDNLQFQFGQVMKSSPKHKLKETLKGHLKKYYLTKLKGLDLEKISAATLVFEGTKMRVDTEKKIVFKTIVKYGGFSAGASNGIRGYFLTFMIAYIRDFALNYHMVCESFETSCPWANVLALCHETKEVVEQVCTREGVLFKPWASCRVTQSYDTGACVYFYFAFITRGLEDPVATLEAIETAARDEIIRHGGSLSHHHGVGKLRAPWMEKSVGGPGMAMLRGVKREIDPKNTMCASNLNLVDDGGFEYYS